MEDTQETTISYSLLEIRDRVDGDKIQSDISQCLSLETILIFEPCECITYSVN